MYAPVRLNNGPPQEVLLDTGCSISMWPKALIDQLGIPYQYAGKHTFQAATRIVEEKVYLAKIRVTFFGRERFLQCHVIEADFEPLLGMDFIGIFGLIMDFEYATCTWRVKGKLVPPVKMRRQAMSKTLLGLAPIFTEVPKEDLTTMQGRYLYYKRITMANTSEVVSATKYVTFRASKSVELKPLHVTLIAVRSDSSMSHEVEVSPPAGLFYRKQCRIAATIAPSNCTKLYITNFSSSTVTLHNNEKVGYGFIPTAIFKFNIKSTVGGLESYATGLKPSRRIRRKRRSDAEHSRSDSEASTLQIERSNYLYRNWNSFVNAYSFDQIKNNKLPPNYPSVFHANDQRVQDMLREQERGNQREHLIQGKMKRVGTVDKTKLKFDSSAFNVNPELEPKQKEALFDLLQKNIGSFAFTTREAVQGDPKKRSKLPAMRIVTGDNAAIKMPPYRKAPKERDYIAAQVQEMLDDGIIVPSDSDFASPVIFVKKKDGRLRFCHDYRKLNTITVADSYPLPRLDDTREYVAGAKYFTTVDMANGYWQIPVDRRDRHKTAFVTHSGLFEYKYVPFGLKNAPAHFQRTMDKILGKLKYTICAVYIDDIIIWSKSFEEHLIRLQAVIDCLAKFDLKLKPDKCHFAQTELVFLGHLLSETGTRPDPRNIAKVLDYPRPTNVKQLRSFLGLAGYYREYVENFSIRAVPLNALLHKSVKWKWSEQCEQAFKYIIKVLTSAPLLAFYNQDLPTFVCTDACKEGLGAILKQEIVEKDDNGKKTITERVIAYWGRSLNVHERNYSAVELECLAAVNAIKHWHVFLYGRHFTVVSDNRALLSLPKIKDKNSRLQNWSLGISDYDYSLVCKKGKLHNDADALSRMPHEDNDIGIVPDEDLMAYKFCWAKMIKSNTNTNAATKTFIQLQLEDAHCTSIREKMRSNNVKVKKKFQNFIEIKGKLYRIQSDRNGDQLFQLVLPEVLILETLKAYHDSEEGGHSGRRRTSDRILMKYWFKNLLTIVRKYVDSCEHCQRKKTPKFAKPPLKPMALELRNLTTRPFVMAGIDVIVLENYQTKSKKKYIFVARCYTTRFLVTGAYSSQSAEASIDFIRQKIIPYFGFIEILVQDRFTAWMSEKFRNQCILWGTEQRFTSGYHPQTNSLVERSNHTIKEMLSAYVGTTGKDWDAHLALATYAINCSVNETTNQAPIYTVYGRIPSNPFDTLLNVEDVRDDGNSETITERIQRVQELAKQRLIEMAEKTAAKSAAKVRQRPLLKAGDKVLQCDPPPVYGKFPFNYKPWHGPYKVVEVKPHNIAVLHTIEETPKIIVANVGRLKRYHDRLKDTDLQLLISIAVHPKNIRRDRAPEVTQLNSADFFLHQLDAEEAALEAMPSLFNVDSEVHDLIAQQFAEDIADYIEPSNGQASAEQVDKPVIEDVPDATIDSCEARPIMAPPPYTSRILDAVQDAGSNIGKTTVKAHATKKEQATVKVNVQTARNRKKLNDARARKSSESELTKKHVVKKRVIWSILKRPGSNSIGKTTVSNSTEKVQMQHSNSSRIRKPRKRHKPRHVFRFDRTVYIRVIPRIGSTKVPPRFT